MENASRAVQRILSIFPDADQSLIAEVVSTVVKFGHTSYHIILQEALNLYLDQDAPLIKIARTSYENEGAPQVEIARPDYKTEDATEMEIVRLDHETDDAPQVEITKLDHRIDTFNTLKKKTKTLTGLSGVKPAVIGNNYHHSRHETAPPHIQLNEQTTPQSHGTSNTQIFYKGLENINELLRHKGKNYENNSIGTYVDQNEIMDDNINHAKTNIDKPLKDVQTNSVLDFKDEWPTLQTCRQSKTQVVKKSLKIIKNKKTAVDLTLNNDDDRDFHVGNNYSVKEETKPDITALDQIVSSILTCYQATYNQARNLSFINKYHDSPQSQVVVKNGSTRASILSPGCSHWPDFSGEDCEKNMVNNKTSENVTAITMCDAMMANTFPLSVLSSPSCRATASVTTSSSCFRTTQIVALSATNYTTGQMSVTDSISYSTAHAATSPSTSCTSTLGSHSMSCTTTIILTSPSTSYTNTRTATSRSTSYACAALVTLPSTSYTSAALITSPSTSYRTVSTSPSKNGSTLTPLTSCKKPQSVISPSPGYRISPAIVSSSVSYRMTTAASTQGEIGHHEINSTTLQPGLSPIPGCSSDDFHDESTNANDSICDSCEWLCQASKTVKCTSLHTICKHCLKKETCNVFTTSKMKVLCPIELCNGEISLNALSTMQTAFFVDILQAIMSNKQTEASLKAIQKLEGIVSCPKCPFSAMLDDNLKIFICANSSCQMVCCRYCKAPWIQEQEEKHTDCCLLMFAGSQCYTDISVIPTNWKTTNVKLCDKFQGYEIDKISLESKEGLAVCDLFKRTSSKIVVGVRRIQNWQLWQKYVLKRAHLVHANHVEEVNEKFLFHGTAWLNFAKICREGFDFRTNVVHGSSFGKGNYFSLYASYSEKYAQNSMFLVSVLCGRSAQGNHKYTRPPYDTHGRMYDSCVDNLLHPSMYIVFSNDQCYPSGNNPFDAERQMRKERRIRRKKKKMENSDYAIIFCYKNEDSGFKSGNF